MVGLFNGMNPDGLLWDQNMHHAGKSAEDQYLYYSSSSALFLFFFFYLLSARVKGWFSGSP